MQDELIDTLADRISERICDSLGKAQTMLKKEQYGLQENMTLCEKQLFLKLRGRIKELGMDHGYLAKKLGMYPHTLSKRMTGKLQWQLDEMYAAMDVLLLPYNRLHEYFPKNGKAI